MMGERMPTEAEAKVLAKVLAEFDRDRWRVTDGNREAIKRCMEDGWLSWRGMWGVSPAGRAALARYRAQKGDGADA